MHRGLAMMVAALGGFALFNGFRTHRRRVILLLMVGGLGLIFAAAWYGDLFPAHAWEVTVTFAGSLLMIAAHRMNHTFCRTCACAVATEKPSGHLQEKCFSGGGR